MQEVAGAIMVAALLTNVVVSIWRGEWGLAVVGTLFPPAGICFGFLAWFGVLVPGI